MSEDRMQRGWRELEGFAGRRGVELTEKLMENYPDLGTFIVEFGYGDLYSRPTLDFKQRALVTIASLVSVGGCERQMLFHVPAALHSGCTREELMEIALHCAPYAGFPKAMDAVFAMKQLFDQMDAEEEENR